MKVRMKKVLRACVEQAQEVARLRRNSVQRARDRVFVEMLIELEETGGAMRYVNFHGQIAWKATAKCRQHLKDLELDAQEDLGDI